MKANYLISFLVDLLQEYFYPPINNIKINLKSNFIILFLSSNGEKIRERRVLLGNKVRHIIQLLHFFFCLRRFYWKVKHSVERISLVILPPHLMTAAEILISVFTEVIKGEINIGENSIMKLSF